MSKMKPVDPSRDNIVSGMLRFSLPIMGVCLLSMMFSLMDTWVITRFGHDNAVSAVGVSSAMINLITGCVSSLSIGITATLSPLYGKDETGRISGIVNILPILAFGLGLLTTVITEVLSGQIMDWLNCDEVLRSDALLYLRIYFLGQPFSDITVFLAAANQSKGDSVHPLIFEMIASVVNIVLNLVFVIAFDWNIFGVAIATVISQILSALLIMIYMMRLDNELRLSPKAERSYRECGGIFKLGLPAAAEGVVLNFTAVVISSIINTFEPDIIAGNTIAQSIEGLIVVSFVGFESASTVFVGQNYGSGNTKRVKQVFLCTAVTVLLLCEAGGILVCAFSDSLLGLFTKDTAITSYAKIRLSYMCLAFGLCGLMNSLSGCVRGLEDSMKPLIISLIGSVAFRLIWVLCYAAPRGSLELIYVSFPICWAICTVLNAAAFIYDLRKSQRQTA